MCYLGVSRYGILVKGNKVKINFLNKIYTITIALTLGLTGSAFAQDNPLLQPAEANPLLQQNTSAESEFEAQARAIDLAATKDSSDPVCQNIRLNYDQELAKIVGKSESGDVASFSQISQHTYSGQGVLTRANRMHRNLGGSYSSGLGKASRKLSQGSQAVNDAAAIGSMLGIGGKKWSQKKAAKKAAKLDKQAMDAVRQTSCPMSTFN